MGTSSSATILEPRVVPTRIMMPSDKTVEIIENIFSKFAGFKKSESLRRKIVKAVSGKSDTDIMEWITYMMSSRGEQELFTLAEDLTNHETFFFRDIVQLDCLENDLLPEVIKRKKKSGDKIIRIWSAACATGEEAYSLAMTAARFMEKQGLASIAESGNVLFRDGWSLKVYGTDISRQVVAIARNGIYSDAGLSPFRSFPPHNFRFFEFLGKTEDRLYHQPSRSYAVRNGIKALTQFECHNLNSQHLPAMIKHMDVVFCRNLMIYLEPGAQKVIQKQFSDALAKGGYMMLSVVDKLHLPELFNEVRLDRNILYSRK